MIKNILTFFTFQNKAVYQNLILICIILFISMILEMAGLSLIVPLVSQIISDEPNIILLYLDAFIFSLTTFNLLEYISSLNIFSNVQSSYVIFTTLVVLFFYTIKVIIQTLVIRFQSIFIYLVHANLSAKLFKKYLQNSYKFHLNNNSANLLKNLIAEIDQLIVNGIVPLILLITDISLIVAVVILLIIFEPIGTFTGLLFIFTMSFTFIKLTNKKIISISTERQIYENTKYKEFQEALGSILEIKVYQKEKYFYDKFYENLMKLREISSYHHFITFIPQVWLEYISIYGLFFIILILTISDSNSASQIATLSLFAASLFRLLPAISRVISSYNRLKFTKVVFQLINNHLENKLDNKILENIKYNFENLKLYKSIVFENVSFKYEKSDKNIFKNASFEIELNKINGLVGKSGVGKSTLVNLLLGVISPDSGKISFSGSTKSSTEFNWLQNFSYVPQKIYLSDESIIQNIAFGEDIKNINQNKINNIIKIVKLDDFIKQLKNGINSSIGERGTRISGGQSQRIGIARLLYQEREIIILDEATSALDKNTEDEILEKLFSKMKNKTFIIIAHRKETIEKCENLYLIEDMKVKKIK